MIGVLNNLQIDALLRSRVVGRIGCQVGDKIYIVPITYCFDGEYIIAHSKEGLKITGMRTNPNVCFQTEQIENMINWQSVIVWGKYEELVGGDARSAMQKFINRFQSLMTTETKKYTDGIAIHQLESGGTKTVVYRIKILEKTGRFEQRIED